MTIIQSKEAQLTPKQEAGDFQLRKLVVAHDASEASARALAGAILLAKSFQSEVLIAHVQPMNEDSLGMEQADNRSDLELVGSRLSANNIKHREVLRAGNIGDSLFNICCEENADLLLLGAYGYNARDRQTLGSSAEHLLRAVPCPVVTYGPNVVSTVSLVRNRKPVLVPIVLPCDPRHLREAVAIAKRFGTRMELLHVLPTPQTGDYLEQEFEKLASQLSSEGVQIGWSVLSGNPAAVIDVQSRILDSPFILMPLRWGKRLSSIAADNVAAHVIRLSGVPVITYRVE
jgi:nucleotide-binding universal stress UspA family protein